MLPIRHVVFPRCKIGPTYENLGNFESFCLANLSKSASRIIGLNIGKTSSKNALASAPNMKYCGKTQRKK